MRWYIWFHNNSVYVGKAPIARWILCQTRVTGETNGHFHKKKKKKTASDIVSLGGLHTLSGAEFLAFLQLMLIILKSLQSLDVVFDLY